MDEPGIGINPLDVDILREMYRTGKVNVAGVDPRLNATEIARRLHTSRARITNRLKRWSESGFVRRYDVWPNPELFGLTGWTVDLRVSQRLRKPDLFQRLGPVDGVVSALEFLGEWTAVQFVAPDEATCRRRAELLRGLAGVAEVGTPLPWQRIEPRSSLTSLDLRIVRALRQHPGANLTEIARAVGISPRTMTTRYEKLVDEWAVWFVPVFDFTRLPLPVVSLNVRLEPAAPHDRVVRAVRRGFPWTLEFGWGGLGPGALRDYVVLFVTLPSAGAIEDLERLAAGVPGVTDVESLVLVRTHSYASWFDELLAQKTQRLPS